jgi:hypothetical protein
MGGDYAVLGLTPRQQGSLLQRGCAAIADCDGCGLRSAASEPNCAPVAFLGRNCSRPFFPDSR